MGKNSPHILTEETEKKLFQETILPYLLSGENITAMWLPHGGRNRAMRYLTQYASRFKFNSLGKYQIILVDPNELTEETPAAYFRLMVSSLAPAKKITPGPEEIFFILKERIKNLVSQGYHLIFILEKFDEINFSTVFFNNLYNLWEFDKFKVHFIFPINKNIFPPAKFQKYGQLRELLSQNLVYFPVFSPPDSLLGIEYFSQKYGYLGDKATQEMVAKLSGGHPSLIKACHRILSSSPAVSLKETISFLNLQEEIKIIEEDIWNCLDEEEKIFLKQLVEERLTTQYSIPSRLFHLKVVQEGKNEKLQIFSPLFGEFIKSLPSEGKEISLNKKTGEILINGYPPKEKISLQEYHLLFNFLQKERLVVSRDEIADILWSKSAEEKYSDWAIDQVISELRKSLKRLGISSQKLQTIRGRGYRWIG